MHRDRSESDERHERDSSGHRRRRYRSRSRTPEARRDHSDPYYRMTSTLVVSNLSQSTDEDTVRYTFAPFGAVKRVQVVLDEASRSSIGVAFIDFMSCRDARNAYEFAIQSNPPLVIDGAELAVKWAKPDHVRREREERGRRESSNRSHLQEIQAQIDWATANAQRAPAASNSKAGYSSVNGHCIPEGYVLDDSGYYVNHQLQVYYDAISRLFYNPSTSAYYRWDNQTRQYVIAVDTAVHDQIAEVSEQPEKSPSEEPTHVSPVREPEVVAVPPMAVVAPVVPLTTTTHSSAAVKFTILGKKQSKDMDRWNKKKAELNLDSEIQSDAPVAPKKLSSANTAPVIKPISSVNVANDSAQRTGGVSARMYISFEKLACLLCHRRFKDEETLRRHELNSDLHKTNLKLDDYEQVQRLEKSAKSLGIDLRPKSGVPPTSKYHNHSKRFAPAVPPPVSATAATPPPPPVVNTLDESNVGNRLMQAMGWKSGQGLGKNNSGITTSVTAHVRSERAGLGAETNITSEFVIEAGDDHRTIRAKKARARFEQGASINEIYAAETTAVANGPATTSLASL